MGRPEERKRALKKAAKNCQKLDNFLKNKRTRTEDGEETESVEQETEPGDEQHQEENQSTSQLDDQDQAPASTKNVEVNMFDQQNDIGLIIHSNMSVGEIKNAIEKLTSGQKYALLKHHKQPPVALPKVHMGGCLRSFKVEWMQQHKWMVYSEHLDGVYCIICALFCSDREKRSVFVNRPFTNWRKKTEKCNDHEQCNYHQEAMRKADDFVRSVENPGASIPLVLDKKRAVNIEKNREILKYITDALLYCGRQGIAIRGKRENLDSDNNSGNFLQLVKVLAKYCPVLERHLKEPEMKCVTYISPQTQNELLEVIAKHIILNDLVNEIKEAKFYSILADEVTSHNTEQLAMVVRFVDSEANIREEFIQFSKVLLTTGEYLANQIIKLLQELGIPLENIRGQGYDGASNMSSGRIGVQAIIRQHSPLATYVHCSGHCLNLVISHSCALPEVRNMIDKLKNCCLFFQNHPKRNELLELIATLKIDNSSKRKCMIDLCRTRWAERHSAYQHFYQAFPFIAEALEVIGYGMHLDEYGRLFENFDKMYKTWSTQTKSDAQQVLTSITSFDFIITFLIVYQYLSHLSGLTVQLQGSSLDILRGYTMVEEIKYTYQKERENIDTSFKSEIFDQAVRMGNKVHTEPSKPRVTSRQQHRSNVSFIGGTVADHYRTNIAIPFLDHIIQNLDSQFSGLAEKASSLLGLVPTVICREPDIRVDEVIKLYWNDLPSPEVVHQEIKRWKARYERISECERPQSPAEAIKECDAAHFPNVRTLLQIACTIPLTSCECERSASTLRRLHSYARATMGQDRLSSLALIHIHYTKHIDLDRVVDIYSSLHPRRLELRSLIKE